MSWHVLLAFIAAAGVIQLVPGPGMLFLVTTAAVGGARAGIATAFGSATAMIVQAGAAALGLAVFFQHVPQAAHALDLVGGAYLIHLAVQEFRRVREPIAETTIQQHRLSTTFCRAALNNLSNPKVILFYLAFLPQFVPAASPDRTGDLFLLGLIFMALGLALDLCLGVGVGRLGDAVLRSPRLQKLMHRTAAGVYAVLGVRLIASAGSGS